MSCTAVKASKHSGKWPRKNLKRNGSRGKCKSGSNHVSYCPQCVHGDVAHPQNAPRVHIARGGVQVRCAAGHTWVTAGKATGVR